MDGLVHQDALRAEKGPLPAGGDGTGTATATGAGRAELVRLVFDNRYLEVHEDIRATLFDPVFDPREGLTATEAGLLAYERCRVVHGRLERPLEIVGNPARLFALAEWPPVLDVSVFSLLMVHYNLCLGTVVEHGGGRPDLDDYRRELDNLTSFGPYMATELGYGNNVAALRTEAVYDPSTETLVINTPGPLAQKFMSYSGFRNIPKIAVVLARLKVAGKDHGVFPFLVRISDDRGLCPGIHVAPCPEKPTQGLDNGVTWFDHVRVPQRCLLLGDMGEFTGDGGFRTFGNPRRRFLRTMSRIVPGRLCVASAAVAAGRASVYIALRYAAQRLTNAPGRNDMPVLAYRSHQLALFGALAKVYAMTFFLNRAKRDYLARPEGVSAELNNLISITKAVATGEMTDVVGVCRERCGAQGMFSVNRMADYVSLLQGLVTAEGDNQVLLANTVGQLLAQTEESPGPPPPGPGDDHLGDPARQLDLLQFRERRLRRIARAALDAESGTRSYFDAWNDTINTALTIARVRGAGLALECFLDAVADARHGEVGRALRLLASLYGLGEVQRDAGWYLARGVLSADQVEGLPAALDSLCDRLAPHASLLVDGFQLTPELVRAPIAADDYVAAYQRLAGAHPPPRAGRS
jgi:acyl-CoA oxidase